MMDIIKPLEWSDIKESDSTCRYTHVFANTPFGRILIIWKGWKEDDDPTIVEAPWEHSCEWASTVEEAKELAEKSYREHIMSALRSEFLEKEDGSSDSLDCLVRWQHGETGRVCELKLGRHPGYGWEPYRTDTERKADDTYNSPVSEDGE